MKIFKTVGLFAIVAAMAATPVLAADTSGQTNTGTDASATSGANVNSGGANSNGSGGVQATTPSGGQVTAAGGGQCFLKTKSGKEVIITCPAGLDVDQ